MAKKLKVWGGLIRVEGKQRRAVVAATSKKKAAEVAGIPLSQLNGFWSETRNQLEQETALAKPETLFVASSPGGADFVEV